MDVKNAQNNRLRLKRLGINAQNEYLVFMRKDCPVCTSEGFEALSRIKISKGEQTIVASLIVWDDELQLSHDQLSLSDSAIEALKAKEGDLLTLNHLDALNSMSDVRK
ncbi:MAG TPA: thymidine phosphorylase, partial [Cytophagales bacterium]|nr:thymidine phosphorylase [Cytophagales bacterium]